MAHKVQASATYGPRISYSTPMQAEEFIGQLVIGTNQSRGSLLAILSEIESISEQALQAGRIVHLPTGMSLRPVVKRDGRIEIVIRPSRALSRRVNGGFRGKVVNARNIGKTEHELIEIWNENHPDDPINP